MVRVLSYGGGVDSFAMLLDAIGRGDRPDLCVFEDVGDGTREADGEDPGEWPGTYRHMREIVIPLCEAHGIGFVWLDSTRYPVRDARSLFAWLEARKQIPVSGPKRICTIIAKVERFERWLDDTFGGAPVEVWIGFEAGEESRAAKDPNAGKARPTRVNRFPLMERGLCRCRCVALIWRHGYAVPRKSACVFCPYGTRADWKTFARDLPDSFAKTVALEAHKPRTKKNNVKLSIMGFSSKRLADGSKSYRDTPLPLYVAASVRARKPVRCDVCGEERATKATGCDYLEEPSASDGAAALRRNDGSQGRENAEGLRGASRGARRREIPDRHAEVRRVRPLERGRLAPRGHRGRPRPEPARHHSAALQQGGRRGDGRALAELRLDGRRGDVAPGVGGMSKPTGWYAADKEGLRLLLERRGIEHALFELYQNADDTRATTIAIDLVPTPGKPLCELSVEDDDPDGFGDLSHAYTLFAESGKKGDPTKAGRFNLGEKLVLARCVEASVTSTKGAIYFEASGERRSSPMHRTQKGSRFWASIRMTRDEYEETSAAMRTLLVRPGLTVTFNGRTLTPREPVREFACTLTTEIGGPGEPLRRTARKTTVRLYEPAHGETPTLYELSCPVVELGGGVWHVQVTQRVPLNMERDNVTPGFLRELRVAVLNEMHGALPLAEASAPWVEDAAADARASAESVERVLHMRYGDKRVGADPSDREAERTAASHGYTIVQPLALSEGLRKRAKATGALTPAGRVFPTPRPISDDPTAPQLKLVPHDKWTAGMERLADYADGLARALLGHGVLVTFASDITWPYAATYAKSALVGGELTFNVGKLGHAFFELPLAAPAVTSLLLHELGHEFGHHLEASYHDGLCKLGSKLVDLALRQPEFFEGGK